MRNWGRTVRVGLVVGIIFFGWYLREYFYKNWEFRLFSVRHWQHVWSEFQSGWVISNSYSWFWLISVLLMIPIFGILWWVSVKISWRKSIKLIYQKIKSFFFKPDQKKVIRKKIKIKSKASHKKVRPKPLVSAGRPAIKQTGRTMDAEKSAVGPTRMEVSPQNEPANNYNMSAQMAPANADMTEPPAFLSEEISNMPLEDIQMPERIRLEEDLVAILSAANYQVVKDVSIGKANLSYVGISTDKIVLCLTDGEKGDWLADEAFFNDEEPLWFSETSHRTSPVYTLLTEAKTFAKKVTDKGFPQTVVPILIEKEGTIINAADMMETWKKMDVVVCRTDLGGSEELPAFGSALPVAQSKGTETELNEIRDLF